MLFKCLYNSELSYDITVKTSKVAVWLQRLLPYSITIFALLLITDTSLLVTTSLFIIILATLLTFQKYVKSRNHTPNHFTLNANNGSIIYFSRIAQTVNETQLLQLTLRGSSRVSFFGCWLYFESQSQSNINLYQPWFIFRDSLSVQDFSRLTRVIKSLPLLTTTVEHDKIY